MTVLLASISWLSPQANVSLCFRLGRCLLVIFIFICSYSGLAHEPVSVSFPLFCPKRRGAKPLKQNCTVYSSLFVYGLLTGYLMNILLSNESLASDPQKKREKENKKEWINDRSSNTFRPDSTTEVNKIQTPHFWNISVFNYKSKCRSECAVNVTFSSLHKWGSGSKTVQPSWSQRQCVLQLRARQHWEVFACDHPRPAVPQLRLPSERSTDALA